MSSEERTTDLGALAPADLHVLECADGELRHSTGIRALAALKALARLAPQRMEKRGFREKLERTRADSALAEREAERFFSRRLPSGAAAGEVFADERAEVLENLHRLSNCSLEDAPDLADSVLGTLSGITKAIQSRRVDVKSFIEEQKVRLGSLCEAAGVQFVSSYALEEEVEAFINRERLADALTELVSNSLKYAFGDSGGTVRLEVEEGQGANDFLVTVADDGAGIPEDLRERVYERGASTGGSGEGLGVVKEIVEEEHLGRLDCSTGEEGTRWRITLPVRVRREALAARLGGPSEAGGQVRPRRHAPKLAPALARAGRAAKFPAAAFAVAVLLVLAWNMVPGRTPEGFRPAPWAGRDILTGWAERIVHPETGMRLVFVPAGKFVMGSDGGEPDEAPAHRVEISRPFYLAESEVTRAQYEEVTGSAPGRGPEDAPVTDVSYLDCLTFCAKVGARLPTEAEWEYAAAGSKPAPPASGPAGIAPTPANALGLRGMLGNAAEWCSDWYGLYEGTAAGEGLVRAGGPAGSPGDVAGSAGRPTAPAANPAGPAHGTRRAVRGGSFLSAPRELRPQARSSLPPTRHEDFVGFRVAVDSGEGSGLRSPAK